MRVGRNAPRRTARRRRTRRACLAATALATGIAALGGAAGAARADDAPPSTTAPPVTAPTTTTSNPSSTPATPTTSTTLPPVATIPANPNGERSALSADQAVAAQAEFATLTDAQRALLRQLQAARDGLATRRFALVALAHQVAAARDQLEQARAAELQARARVDETQEQLRRVKDEVAHLAAAAYRNRTGSKVFGAVGALDVESASILARAGTYAESDVSSLRVRVDALSALERRLETNRRVAESARTDAESSAADLDAHLADQKQAFQEASDATARAQAAVSRSLGSDARLVAQMVNPQFGADDITSVLAFVQAGQGEPPSRDGIFFLPIAGAPLTSPYGLRIDPIEGTVGFHPGLDFGADARTPIHAAGAGMVVVAGDCGGYGNCVVIDHGSSLATLYGHQTQVLVRVGDAVTPGQVVGPVGSTGISTGPHLHFEVRLHGTPIDPVPTLTN
jgi:murein DD-endopeptidase MepM/ murein hydrolase activator NlpD